MSSKMIVSKNMKLRRGEFDVDVYLPHYSTLGIDISEIKKKTTVREGFIVPKPEMLLSLKLYAWRDRQGSLKGRKDELDIFSLATLPEFDWDKYLDYVGAYRLEEINNLFLNLIKKTSSVQELGINEQKMAKMKKTILAEIGKQG